MKKPFKLILSSIIVCMILLSCTATAFAADKLEINSETSVNVGDTVKYTLYLGDCTEKVEGIQMYIYYDKDYLKVDENSLKYKNLEGVIQNPKCDGYITFNWTNVTELADFSKKNEVVSLEFKVVKGGKTDITQFIQELYGDNMKYLKSYKTTYTLKVNDETLVTDKAPLIQSDETILNKRQGDFVNYEDGMGEENTPNKDNHISVTGTPQNGTRVETQYVDVTKDGVANGSNNNSTQTIVIIIAIVIVLAIVVVIILKSKDKNATKNNDEDDQKLLENTDTSNTDNSDNQ